MDYSSLFFGINIKVMEHWLPQMLFYKPFYNQIFGFRVLYSVIAQICVLIVSFLSLKLMMT